MFIKNFVLLLTYLLGTSAWAQIDADKPGEEFFNVKIVASREDFKMTDGEHKTLMGLYLQTIPYKDVSMSGNALSRVQYAPFEIHIQGDNLSRLNLASIRAAMISYLYVDNVAKGFSIQTELNALDIDYKNFGLNEPADKQLQIFDLAMADTKTGIRYTTKDGTYFVFGAIAGFGPGGDIKGDRDKMGLHLKNFDAQADAANPDNTINNATNLELFGGGFAEINVNQKIKIYGSAKFGTKSVKDNWQYSTLPENVVVHDPADTQNPNSTASTTLTHYRTVDISTQRSAIQVRVVADLGKLITPTLTGVALSGGLDLDRYQITYDRAEVSTALGFKGQGKVDNPVKFETNAPLHSFNQLNINIALSLSPSAIIGRQAKARKLRALKDLYP
jgi:hypothetical protein